MQTTRIIGNDAELIQFYEFLTENLGSFRALNPDLLFPGPQFANLTSFERFMRVQLHVKWVVAEKRAHFGLCLI